MFYIESSIWIIWIRFFIIVCLLLQICHFLKYFAECLIYGYLFIIFYLFCFCLYVFVCCFLIYIFFSGMRSVAAFHTRDYVTITRNVVLAIALYQVLGVLVVYVVPVVIVSRYEIAETILQFYYLKITYLTLNIRYVFIKCFVSVF